MTIDRKCPFCGNGNADDVEVCVWCDRVLPDLGATTTKERPVRLLIYAASGHDVLLEMQLFDGVPVHLGRGRQAGAIGRALERTDGMFRDVGRKHAHLIVEGLSVVIADDGSTWGTWVNRERLNGGEREFGLPVEIRLASSCRIVVERLP